MRVEFAVLQPIGERPEVRGDRPCTDPCRQAHDSVEDHGAEHWIGREPEPEIVATCLRGLGEIGFVDGQNVRIEALPIRANSRLMHRSK
jgi:hypothetical protein